MHAQILPRLRKDIVNNRWAPGERLREPALCEEFGVSRTPLRDALRVLETEGLIEVTPHVGAVVTHPGSPDMEAKLEVLGALEALAAELAARRRPPAPLQRIARLHKEMGRAAKSKDVAGYYKLNDEFHRQIVLASGNAALADMHEHLMWHVYRVRHMANEQEQLSQDSAHEHDVIVEAILAGRHEQAARAMRSHLHSIALKVAASPSFRRLGESKTRRAG
jgi:DNA-binding GntR family transcriptional regulator